MSGIIRTEELWNITNLERMKPLIKRRKWNWIGHTHWRYRKNCAELNPQGARKRGRPKQLWKIASFEEEKGSGQDTKSIAKLRELQ